MKSLQEHVHAWIAAAFATAHFCLFYAMPRAYDIYLAFPLAKSYLRPELYNSKDILVSSGNKGPFFVYKLFSFLFSGGYDVEWVWYQLFLLFTFLLFLSVWYLAKTITESDVSATAVAMLIAFVSPHRGTLHSSALPLIELVTATFVIPLCLWALTSVLEKKYARAALLAGASFNLHPYNGLIAMCLVTGVLLTDDAPSRKEKIKSAAIMFLASLPNVVFLCVHFLQPQAQGAGLSSEAFFEKLSVFSDHIYVDQYLREGYGWFFITMSVAFYALFNTGSRHKKALTTILCLSLIMMAGYTLNTYVLHSRLIALTYIFRVTYFLKPILFSIVIGHLSNRMMFGEDGRDNAMVVPLAVWLVSSMVENIACAEALALCGCYFMLAVDSFREESPLRFLFGGLFIVALAELAWICSGATAENGFVYFHMATLGFVLLSKRREPHA